MVVTAINADFSDISGDNDQEADMQAQIANISAIAFDNESFILRVIRPVFAIKLAIVDIINSSAIPLGANKPTGKTTNIAAQRIKRGPLETGKVEVNFCIYRNKIAKPSLSDIRC